MATKTTSLDIQVHHITRVEGHGNIVVRAADGKIEQVEWRVPEAPRFFEAMVRGRSWEDIQTVVSRICGICSVAHSLAAVKAIEDAMDIPVSEQTERLRMLGLYGEFLESHILHVGYLVAPDLLGVKSVVPLVSSHPDLVKLVIRLHRLGNTMMEIIGGRRTHPLSYQPGGFALLPGEADLRRLRADLESALPDLETLAQAVLGLADKIPDFKRDTEYIALVDRGTYTFYQGNIGSSDTTKTVAVQKFKTVANEYVTPQSTAKWARWHRSSYMVGALARFNLNVEYLYPRAAEIARLFRLERGCCNPYMNTVVQVVESVHSAEHSLELIDELLTAGIKQEPRHVKARGGWGAGAVEAPRGLLCHSYAFDDNGICTNANLTIPTNQNHANIQHDMEALVPTIINEGPERVRLLLEMLVRAYDPCISCSTHMLDVTFI
ncbi:MAG: Ni/Fe hydrogenase subunit alpha [Armatimonadota bacterium]